ncbi:MAG TPA: hypothetical protein VJ124_02710 [Pyrinomonadaceae bacterium]|nr:hypothetical protein [Pyrinomonadaceae bacterium]
MNYDDYTSEVLEIGKAEDLILGKDSIGPDDGNLSQVTYDDFE